MPSTHHSKRQPSKCPPHIARVAMEYWLARETFEVDLEAACRGHLGSDEEADYRADHPAPLFKDFLADYYAAWRHDHTSHAA